MNGKRAGGEWLNTETGNLEESAGRSLERPHLEKEMEMLNFPITRGLSAGLEVHTQPFTLKFYSFLILSV